MRNGLRCRGVGTFGILVCLVNALGLQGECIANVLIMQGETKVNARLVLVY